MIGRWSARTGFHPSSATQSAPAARPYADGASLGRNHAELSHRREDVDDSPGLSDPPVDEPDDEDLVVRDGFASRWDAHVFALVGPGDRVAADDLVPRRSGNARWSLPNTSFNTCAPVASIGTGARICASGSTSSSIVFDMTSGSVVFMASQKRMNVALLLVAWAVDIRILLGSI
jgi:hypothetical protein